MPPSEASAPGSTGKNSPVSRRCVLSALRVTPGWIDHVHILQHARLRTWSILLKSSDIPPAGAFTCPSREVPVPKGTIGTRCAAQIRTISCTSSVERGKITASGACVFIHVVVCPCCSRSACPVSTRSAPNRCRNRSSATAIPASFLGKSAISAMSRPPGFPRETLAPPRPGLKPARPVFILAENSGGRPDRPGGSAPRPEPRPAGGARGRSRGLKPAPLIRRPGPPPRAQPPVPRPSSPPAPRCDRSSSRSTSCGSACRPGRPSPTPRRRR
jgi:hypothetical protein